MLLSKRILSSLEEGTIVIDILLQFNWIFFPFPIQNQDSPCKEVFRSWLSSSMIIRKFNCKGAELWRLSHIQSWKDGLLYLLWCFKPMSGNCKKAFYEFDMHQKCMISSWTQNFHHQYTSLLTIFEVFSFFL